MKERARNGIFHKQLQEPAKSGNDGKEKMLWRTSVYKRADIVAILTMAVDCMREQLLGGQKIQLGDLGDFSISINSLGAESAADYNPAIHVRKLNVNWSAGTRFQNLQEEAVFNLVATRKAARLVVKALKAGKTSVDLTGEAKEPENGGQA